MLHGDRMPSLQEHTVVSYKVFIVTVAFVLPAIFSMM